jgi:hypothetical protein
VVHYTFIGSCISAGANQDTIYLTDYNQEKVWRYIPGSGSAQDITPSGMKGGVLSVSGNLMMNAWQDSTGPGSYPVNYCIYDLATKSWGTAQPLATENVWCKLGTDQIALPNFFPVLWTPSARQFWMKVAKIPTGDSGTTKADRALGPVKFTVLQSYPNPAGSSTVVRFGIKTAQKVSIRLYSLNGRLIETLASGKYENGSHEVTCRFSQALPAGIYALRLEANGRAEVKNITILK